MQESAAVPRYLQETYWWAYVHPSAVRLFERQWLVNLILWGNFARLRDAALDALGPTLPGRTLQVACVYGDFTPRMAARLADGGSVDVVDVLPIQLANLDRKLGGDARVRLLQRDACDLRFDDGAYDRVALFFLLHEMPLEVRRRTLSEALRVLKPGGEVVIVDYHRPAWWHPLRPLMSWILRRFEPFAHDLWSHEVSEWLPAGRVAAIAKRTYWGG
ncbi:MAG TPA: rhodoquinone biosynthesis methyltransferase RquA, partial [Myxococcota bacterium]|nr:rhodoquinone biosynthesis methyltransferase RquA [Myxococcota bacterium]